MSTISFDSKSTSVISSTLLETINNNIASRSVFYNDRLQDVLASNKRVVVTVGYADEIGASTNSASTWLDEDGIIRISIPFEMLQGQYYESFFAATIERVIAHEIGGHAWQIATGNYFPFDGEGAESPHEIDALYTENMIMEEAFDETWNSEYGFGTYYGFGGRFYTMEGMETTIRQSQPTLLQQLQP